jgi:hypothetical protein
VFVATIFEEFRYLGPFFALWVNVADEFEILLELPFVFWFVGVKVVQPTLTALLGRAEIFTVGSDIQFLGELAPLVFSIFFSE